MPSTENMGNAPRNNTTNDNQDPWQTLSAATERLLENENQDHERDAGDGDPEQRSEGSEKARREYIDQRLRDFAAFERRARGGGRK